VDEVGCSYQPIAFVLPSVASSVDGASLDARPSGAPSSAEHMDVLKTTTTLATTLFDEGRFGEAETLQRRVLAVELRNRPEHPSTALDRYNLACTLAREGKREEAISLLRQALDQGLSSDGALGIEKDGDLVSLREDRRFQAIVTDAKTRYGQPQ
jgi:hypothetical protein